MHRVRGADAYHSLHHQFTFGREDPRTLQGTDFTNATNDATTGPVSSFSDFDDTNSQQAKVPWYPILPGSTIERGSKSCALSDPVRKFREFSTAVEELFLESFVGI